MLNMYTFGNTADISAIIHLVPHACQHITVDQSHSSGDTVTKILEIRGEGRHKDCPSQTPIRKSRTGLNPGTGVATALTRHLLVLCLFQNTKWVLTFPERHICYYCLLAANESNNVHGLFLKKTSTVSLSIDVRITMIRGVVNLLRIFKMFHGLMNNPVLLLLWWWWWWW